MNRLMINYFSTMLIFASLLVSLYNENLFSQSQPKAWYVYKNATGLNNGTSWQNAWNSFGAINWGNVNPGDTVYISGGTDSLVYYETLTMGTAFGIAGSPLVIKKATVAGHNGKVIIDGQNIRENGIFFDNDNDYVTIDGITVRNTTDYAIIAQSGWTGSFGAYRFSSNHHKGITIKNCRIEMTNAAGIALKGVEDFYGNKNVIISSSYGGQTDGYWIQACKNIVVDGDSILIFNTNPTPHCDGIQANQDTSTIVKNCYIAQYNTKSSNAQGIYLTDSYGAPQIYNNIVNLDSSSSNGIAVRQLTYGNLSDVIIYNNTIINNSVTALDHPIWVTEVTFAPKIKNNIIACFGVPGAGITAPSYTNTQYNLQYNVLATRGTNVITTNPLFTNSSARTFTLQLTSPARDAGTNLGSPYNVDKLGVSRPQGSAWDLGAHEFFESQLTDNIPPEIISASLLDSITLNIIFSEPLNLNGAINSSNYLIDNGINVNSVELSGNNVRLHTSIHSPGFYTVVVSNVTDTAGNLISHQNNTATYGYNPDPLPGILKFVPTGTNASSIPEPEHLPEKTFDGLGYNSGDPNSRWAGNNLPQWIGYDLGNAIMLNKTRVQFYKWNEGRIYNYSIMTSTDSVNWVTVRQNIQSTNTEWTEEIFEPVPARYIRIIVHSNNQNDWASLWETEFYGNLILSNNDKKNNNLLPTEFSLEQNFPNPFNPSTKIRFSIPKTETESLPTELVVFDILGNELTKLVDEYIEPGVYEFEFNASNLPSGVYFYRLSSGNYNQIKKMVLLK